MLMFKRAACCYLCIIFVFLIANATSVTTNCVSSTSPNVACCSGDIELVANMVTISVDAFKNCNGLTSVVIPATVVTIGNGAFHGCTS